MSKVQHIVLLRIPDGVAPEKVQEMISALKSLRDEIPGIESLTMGRHDNKIFEDYKDRSDGFTHALIVCLKSPEDLQAYSSNEKHLDVVEKYIKPISERVLAIDFQDEEVVSKCCWSRGSKAYKHGMHPCAMVVTIAAFALGCVCGMFCRHRNKGCSAIP